MRTCSFDVLQMYNVCPGSRVHRTFCPQTFLSKELSPPLFLLLMSPVYPHLDVSSQVLIWIAAIDDIKFLNQILEFPQQ